MIPALGRDLLCNSTLNYTKKYWCDVIVIMMSQKHKY